MTAGRATATRPIATFPHMGNYSRVLKELAQLIDVEVQAPPPITRHTLEVGASHSPEFVCVPFKYNLGNFIEALEAGAQVIIQAGGGCRFGYYGEVQETILRDLGYEFDFIAISTAPDVKSILKFLRRYNRYPKKSEVVRVMDLTRAKVRALDEIEQMVRLRVGFEVEPGQHEEVLARFLDALEDHAPTLEAVEHVLGEYREAIEEIEIDRPDDVMRIGIVGELYVLMEPFSNMNIERYLASRGVEVHRFCTVSAIIDHALEGRANLERMLSETGPYVHYHLGAEATESVFLTLRLMDEKFDGVVHVKPFG